MRCYVLMGVSGCGKTSVGKALAAEGGIHFIDGDDLHPEANIAKMSRGEPLDDKDREPWLVQIGQALAQHKGQVIIGCSALKRRYRDLIRANAGEPVAFLHLAASKAVLAKRVAHRPGHFMPAALLDSQYEALEELQTDEDGAYIDIDRTFNAVVQQARRHITQG